MTAHTPGPWFVDANGKVWRRDPRELYENGGGVAGDHPIATAHRGWSRWENGFPVEANARLIAAAPDLLDVAQRSAAALVSAGVESNANGDNPLEGLLHMTLAAIAKAKGEQP